MRMWNINPTMMCRKHLLGEHLECHMFVGAILKGKSINGYINRGLVEVHNIKFRHDELVKEMIKRGYNHKSPLPNFEAWEAGNIDILKNFDDLTMRCPECRINGEFKK